MALRVIKLIRKKATLTVPCAVNRGREEEHDEVDEGEKMGSRRIRRGQTELRREEQPRSSRVAQITSIVSKDFRVALLAGSPRRG